MLPCNIDSRYQSCIISHRVTLYTCWSLGYCWYLCIMMKSHQNSVCITDPFSRETADQPIQEWNDQTKDLAPVSIKRWHLTNIGNPVVQIRWSQDCLISMTRFPIVVRCYIKIGISSFTTTKKSNHIVPQFHENSDRPYWFGLKYIYTTVRVIFLLKTHKWHSTVCPWEWDIGVFCEFKHLYVSYILITWCRTAVSPVY